MNQIVLNTSSSLFFTKIGLVSHLLKHFAFVTTPEIFEEIKIGEEIGFKDARIMMHYFETGKVKIIIAKKTEKIAKEFRIKTTDASVIALAQELGCFLATEDKQIEKICLLLQTKITNTAVLLHYLWQKDEFSDAQTFLLLDLLGRNGYNKETCLKIKEKIIGGGKHD